MARPARPKPQVYTSRSACGKQPAELSGQRRPRLSVCVVCSAATPRPASVAWAPGGGGRVEEHAEHGRAAAGHRRVIRAERGQGPHQPPDRRVPPHHRRLQVVAQPGRPGRPRCAAPRHAGRRRRGGPSRSNQRVGVGRGDAERRHAPRRPTTVGGSASGEMSSPRPIPSAVPPARKNGTSAPSRAASHARSTRSSFSPHSRVSATSVAAASALPPPRPACDGMRLTSRTRIPAGAFRRGTATCPSRIGGAPDQVAVAGGNRRVGALDHEPAARRREGQGVVQAQRLQHGAHVVIAVGEQADDAQVEVDLGVRAHGERGRRHQRVSGPAVGARGLAARS